MPFAESYIQHTLIMRSSGVDPKHSVEIVREECRHFTMSVVQNKFRSTIIQARVKERIEVEKV